MAIQIFDYDLLSQEERFFESKAQLSKNLETIISGKLGGQNVNVIFTSLEKMKDLNYSFRKKKEATDVLSFNFEEEEFLGEVYICPEFVRKSFQGEKFKKETLRLILHGILHLIGHSHKGQFVEEREDREEMFVEQEELLQKLCATIESKD